MNPKNKYIIITIIGLFLISGVTYYFFLKSVNEQNNISKIAPMTEEQKLSLLSSTSSAPVKIISDEEKKKILNESSVKSKPANILSPEEIARLMDKTI